MKKALLSATFVLMGMTVFSQAYFSIKKDTLISNIQFFKNEIYKSPRPDLNSEKISFLFGEEIMEIKSELCQPIKENKIDIINDSLVKIKDTSTYLIDLSRINAKNIKCISFDNTSFPLSKNIITSISKNKTGKRFRLIIPNSPTIVYKASDFAASITTAKENVIEPKNIEENKDDFEGGDKTQKSFLKKYSFYIITLLLLLTGFVIYYFRTKKLTMDKIIPIQVLYKGGKLSKVAKNNKISFDDLLILNDHIIPNNYKELSEEEKKRIQVDLKGQHLFVKKASRGKADSTTSSSTGGDIFESLRNMEFRLLDKISSLNSDKSALEEKKNLIREKDSLEIQLKEIKEKNLLQSNAKIEIENQITVLKESLNTTNVSLKKYSDRLLFADFLENYAKVTVDHFALLKLTLEKTQELLKKLSSYNEKDTIILSLFLCKCQMAIPSKSGNWEEIVLQIKDCKTISNLGIIRSFSQLPNNEEKISAFQKQLLREVLEKYTGAILLLTEELRNFSTFSEENSGFIKEIELSFTPLLNEIINKAKSVGLDVNYVPLFVSSEPYVKITRSVSEKHQLPYSNIKVEKDFISEIISYGFGNNPTTIITA